jgi:hypothetical protein
MGLRVDALKGSKQMEQDMFVIENECRKALMREKMKKKWNQFFGNCIEKHLTLDENGMTILCGCRGTNATWCSERRGAGRKAWHAVPRVSRD